MFKYLLGKQYYTIFIGICQIYSCKLFRMRVYWMQYR